MAASPRRSRQSRRASAIRSRWTASPTSVARRCGRSTAAWNGAASESIVMIITLALRVSRALRSAFGAFALALNALWRCAAEPGPQRAAPLTVPDQRRTTAQELRAAPRPGHARPLAALLLIAGTLAAASAARAQLAPPGAGEVRALVIGIDHYATRRNLRGAVADARDVEQALRKGGVRDLTVLIDAEATRAQVLTAI